MRSINQSYPLFGVVRYLTDWRATQFSSKLVMRASVLRLNGCKANCNSPKRLLRNF
jgi:hypothetical protein